MSLSCIVFLFFGSEAKGCSKQISPNASFSVVIFCKKNFLFFLWSCFQNYLLLHYGTFSGNTCILLIFVHFFLTYFCSYVLFLLCNLLYLIRNLFDMLATCRLHLFQLQLLLLFVSTALLFVEVILFAMLL